jgi:hypothetical protein
MDQKIVNEVLRVSLIGFAIGAPLKYYLLKHHSECPTQNALVLVVFGLVTGHFLFAGCRDRLAGPKLLPEPTAPYMLGNRP